MEYAVRGCQVRCPNLAARESDDAMASMLVSSAPTDDHQAGKSGFEFKARVAPHMCLVDANAKVKLYFYLCMNPF